MKFIKLQKVADYKHGDGSVSQSLPHGYMWVKPEHVILVEETVKGPTQIMLSLDSGGRYGSYMHQVKETPEQIMELLLNG